MNWADWAIIGILLISGLISLKRGFIKEALSLLTWIAAFVIARLFSGPLSQMFTGSIETPSVRLGLAFAVLFVVTLIVGAILNNLIGMLVKATGLSGTDRTLGMAFGLARGGLLVIVMIAILKLTPVTQDVWWQSSVLIPHFLMMEDWSQALARDASSLIMGIGS